MLMRNKKNKDIIIEVVKWLGFKNSYCFANIKNGVDSKVTPPSWFPSNLKTVVIVPLKENPIIPLNQFWRVNDDLFLGTGDSSFLISPNQWIVKYKNNAFNVMKQSDLLNNFYAITLSGYN